MGVTTGHDGLEGHYGHDHRLSTCVSAASASGGQKVIAIDWDIAMAVGNSVRPVPAGRAWHTACRGRRNDVPTTMTIDGSNANEAAIKSYNAEHGTAIVIR
jgi:hypothetical protein